MKFDCGDAVNALNEGGVIAYPTEGVFGLGCDPDNSEALKRLITLKRRSKNKGLILIAGNYSQLLPYVDDNAITQDKRFTVLSRWPGAITQVMPANSNINPLLTGEFTTIAVRVTQHPLVIELCRQFNKPIVSTSANISGNDAATQWQDLDQELLNTLDYVVKADTLGLSRPSKIIDALTGEVLRS